MQDQIEKSLSSTLRVPTNLVSRTSEALRHVEKQLKYSQQHGKLPEQGMDEFRLKRMMLQAKRDRLVAGHVILNDQVDSRWYGLTKPFGEDQCGLSGILIKRISADALHSMGYRGFNRLLIVPWATGMSIAVCLSQLMINRDDGNMAADHRSDNPMRYQPPASFEDPPGIIYWLRIDQKSCIKATQLLCGHCRVEVVENIQDQDELCTDVESLRRILSVGSRKGQTRCVVSTTSCFAPRVPDNLEAIAKLCMQHGVCHVVNNAYGLQSRSIAMQVERAARVGRIDLVVQSLDKNFMVPVGSSLVLDYSRDHRNQDCADRIDKLSSHVSNMIDSHGVDLLITLMGMGKQGLQREIDNREAGFVKLRQEAKCFVAENERFRLLETPRNPISMAVAFELDGIDSTFLGSSLFSKQVSGCRVLDGSKSYRWIKSSDVTLQRFGTHTAAPQKSYFNIAAAIGISDNDIGEFFRRLRSLLGKLEHKRRDGK